MFTKRKGFRKQVVQGLDCWLPPIGKVYNHFTKEVEEVDIIQRSPAPKTNGGSLQNFPLIGLKNAFRNREGKRTTLTILILSWNRYAEWSGIVESTAVGL